MVRGFVELEAAKAVLLGESQSGVAADEVVPALQQLEEFRNSLCQVDHLLVAAVERFGLAEQQCVSSVEKLMAQVLQISMAEAKRRVRAAAGVGPRYVDVGGTVAGGAAGAGGGTGGGSGRSGRGGSDRAGVDEGRIWSPRTEVAETEECLVGYGQVFEPTELERDV